MIVVVAVQANLPGVRVHVHLSAPHPVRGCVCLRVCVRRVGLLRVFVSKNGWSPSPPQTATPGRTHRTKFSRGRTR